MWQGAKGSQKSSLHSNLQIFSLKTHFLLNTKKKEVVFPVPFMLYTGGTERVKNEEEFTFSERWILMFKYKRRALNENINTETYKNS